MKYPIKLNNIICTDVGLDMFKSTTHRSAPVDFATYGMAGDKVAKPMYKSDNMEDYITTLY